MTPARALLLALAWLTAGSCIAAEGMWTLDNLPRETLKQDYNFEPEQAWVSKLQRASLRVSGGCSGAFVSPNGLVLTNQHCVRHCLAQLSGRQDNLLQSGFVTSQPNEEAICPQIELNQLLEIKDVTASINTASQDLSQTQALDARRAAMASLEQACVQDDVSLRCEVVSLYHGAQFHLYKYRRYQDVRLAFAPEAAIAAFGGHPDTARFPRYVLDMALLRAYRNGQAVDSPDYFSINPQGAQIDEPVFVTGHPGRTQRSDTVAQLLTLRDVILPQRLAYLAELRGVMRQFSHSNSKAQRIAQRDYLAIEDRLTMVRGRHTALVAPGFIDARQKAEKHLRERVNSKRKLRKTTADAWDEIEQAQQVLAQIHLEYALLERMRGYQSDLLSIARHLVRAASERSKPNAQRLREYTQAALPQLTQRLFSGAPIHDELETLTLSWSLEKLREWLGPDHPAVRLSLGTASPAQRAQQLISQTSLHDLSVRRTLWEGGAEAIRESQDPLIIYARKIDGPARQIRRRYDRQVRAVIEHNQQRISQARFALDGTSRYPDASSSLRLSHGQIQGWQQGDSRMYPHTTVSGLLARSTGQAPYSLPASWRQAEPDLDLTTIFNISSSHDIVGGNSGSPMLNRQGELVGLVFGGNRYAAGGTYAYDSQRNRAVSLHPAAISEALSKVYAAGALHQELFP